MHVGGNAILGHQLDNAVAQLPSVTVQAHEHQVPARRLLARIGACSGIVGVAGIRPIGCAIVLQDGHVKIGKVSHVPRHHLAASCEHARVTAQLRQAQTCLQVGHVALPAGEGHVVFPSAGLGLGKRVFRLAVQRHEHEIVVQLIGIEQPLTPGDGTAFCRGEVLHRMEAERGKVGNLACALSVAHAAKGMRSVGDHGDAADGLLAGVCGRENASEGVDGVEQRIVVAHDAGQIDGDDGLRVRGDKLLQLSVIHLVAAGRHIAQHGRRTHMADGRAAGGVGIGARDHLVARTDAQRAQGALKRRRGRTQARHARRAQKGGKLALELLGLRARGDPSAPQRIGHLGDFGFGDIGWGKRDADLFGHGISLAIRLKRQANERMLTQGGVPFDDDVNRGVYIRLRRKFTMAR